MNNTALEYEIKKLEGQRAELTRQIEWILKHHEKIPEGFTPSFCGDKFDFNYLPHDQVVQVIKAFGGKWEKTPNGEDAVDYSQEIDGVVVRCYCGAPPPNCKVVEVEVEIPAQPATKTIVRKLVCKEVVDASQSL